MDVTKTLQCLHEQKRYIEQAISALENLQTGSITPRAVERRGRKSMNAAEREEVSRRMKRYWANRRKNS